jgi:preprotein translocase subunit SecA
MITRSLEKAQTKIEELNFDARKHVLSYDDVLNIQRKSVYTRRSSILQGGKEAIDTELSRIAEGNDEWQEVLRAKRAELKEAFYTNSKQLLLQVIDHLWVEHLEGMEYLRSSVNLRAYGQRDPLVEYKKEGLALFHTMETIYSNHVMSVLQNMAEQQVETTKEEQSVTAAAKVITAQGQGSGIREYGRNEHVTITNGTETRQMKYKKVEGLIRTGVWRVM